MTSDRLKDRKTRCDWCLSGNDLYVDYHDSEWGVPVHDDQTQFEFLILEGAQAGLSWSTVLNKREGYRKAFANFDPVKVARFTDKKVVKLLGNPAIIRNKLKVNAAVTNARQFLKVQDELAALTNTFGSSSTASQSRINGKPANRFRQPAKNLTRSARI